MESFQIVPELKVIIIEVSKFSFESGVFKLFSKTKRSYILYFCLIISLSLRKISYNHYKYCSQNYFESVSSA